MPTIRNHAALWTREDFERSVKYAMELDRNQTPKELKVGTIILEGDLKVKIKAWDQAFCVVRYGKKYRKEVTLRREFMKFRYAKEKARAV